MATYRQLVLLGLLLERPMYGQQVSEVIEQHHHLFAGAIKKPTIYYQLDRLAQEGYLEARQETVDAPGTGLAHDEWAPREREVYHITARGRAYFVTLLRQALSDATSSGEAPLNDLDAGLFFLDRLPPAETVALLRARYERVARDRAALTHHLQAGQIPDQPHQLVTDHQLALLDAEMSWLARTLLRLQASTPTTSDPATDPAVPPVGNAPSASDHNG